MAHNPSSTAEGVCQAALQLTTRTARSGTDWGGGRDKHPSQEVAAEYLWELFIKQAQS